MIKNIPHFSILMVISESDSERHAIQALKSVCIDQTLKATELVIVRNGQLTNRMLGAINYFSTFIALKLLNKKKMVSLAKALNEGLYACSYDLVARMDPDDIAYPDRFNFQIQAFQDDPSLSVCGTLGEEFDDRTTYKFVKKLPLTNPEIFKFAKWRCPIIHPSTIFRKSAVLNVGGYPLVERSQDYLLWTKMLKKNYKFLNLNRPLIKIRADKDLARRRGKDYYFSELEIFYVMYTDHFISFFEYFINLFLRFFVRLSPPSIRLWFYSKRPGSRY